VGTVLSRRLCEVLGVVFFGLALLWVISLASYSASDPVAFFSTAAGRPGNFGGRAGALLAELAFQVLGFAAYLLVPPPEGDELYRVRVGHYASRTAAQATVDHLEQRLGIKLWVTRSR